MHPDDRDAYTDGKTDFVAFVLSSRWPGADPRLFLDTLNPIR